MEVSRGQRYTIGLFGNTNSGKSTLMNAITGQELSIVSDIPGTTTDPITKNIELHGTGPAVLIDTAGFDDNTELSAKRLVKTFDTLNKCDLILAVISLSEINQKNAKIILQTDGFNKIISSGKKIIWVITKIENGEKIPSETKNQFNELKLSEPIFVDSINHKNIDLLLEKIKKTVPDGFYSRSLTEKYCKQGENVLLVMPQDKEAPKGRLILPQVETIRDLLDRDVLIHSCTERTFIDVINSLKNPPDLIITDSKIYGFINQNKPSSSRLTTFSIIMADNKGDIKLFKQGALAINKLTNNSRVLIAEACSHVPETEDIGRVKIPQMLKKIAPQVQIDFVRGTDFINEEDVLNGTVKYDLIIHCGACMFNRSYMLERQKLAQRLNIPMTNYGLAFASQSN